MCRIIDTSSFNRTPNMAVSKIAAAKSPNQAWFFTPVLAPLLQNRMLVSGLSALAILQVGLTILGLPGWRCPLELLLGLPCPGCGMTTALALLFKGSWQSAIHVHAFSPLFLILILILAVNGALPAGYHHKFAHAINSLEKRTGITIIVIGGMIGYWVIRLYFGYS